MDKCYMECPGELSPESPNVIRCAKRKWNFKPETEIHCQNSTDILQSTDLPMTYTFKKV